MRKGTIYSETEIRRPGGGGERPVGGIASYVCVCERVWEDVTYLTLSEPLSDIVESEGRVLQVVKDPQV